jgi:hypothetical protein
VNAGTLLHLPDAARVELPLLQELYATGGSDQLRYLSERLVRYFPQLPQGELCRPSPERRRWLRLLSRTVQRLMGRGELLRQRTRLELTDKGVRRAQAEALCPEPAPVAAGPRTHEELQRCLLEIGQVLGKHAEAEVDTYDVVWRDRRRAPRLSHVFEVQVRGSVDSALTRLKRAHEAQRSRLFLVIADERARAFAARRLALAFPEIADQVTLLGAGELVRLHQALVAHRELVARLLG